MMHFGEVLEAADQLSIEEQETLVEVLHRRIVEHRREELALEIREARRQLEAAQCAPATPEEIIEDILS
jgi:hypothetical protein